MKLGIIGGAGLLGSTTAFVLGLKDLLDEIRLIDVNADLLGSHVMDMEQALLPISRTKVIKAEYADLGDCDIVLITASLPERKVNNRNEYLEGNLSIIKSICKELKKHCNDPIIICCTNPTDVFNYITWKLLGWNKNKFLGFSLNDTLRLKWAVSTITGKEYSKLVGFCIGEHGDGQVRLFEQMKYNGKPIRLNRHEEKKATHLTSEWFQKYQQLESGRTTGWTSAINLARIIEAIVLDSKDVIPCSTILIGEYGYNGLSMGMPVSIGRDGVNKIELPELTDQQKQGLDNAAFKIKSLINMVSF